MTTDLEYALLAANVYGSKDIGVTGAEAQIRHPRNTLPVPDGWVAAGAPVVNSDGFMAQAYRRGNEIVISYAGTTNEDVWDWVTGNVPAATAAALAPQVTDAAKFYLDVLAANPGAQITFTGHSLGGGLASLMAVYFNCPATVFDEAPFLKSADSLTIVESLRQKLQWAGYTVPPELRDYVAYDQTGAFIASPTRAARDDQVKQIFTKGEALSVLSTTLTNFLAIGLGRLNVRLGITGFGVDKINNGAVTERDPRAQTLLGWGASLNGVAITDGDPVSLHSITLLTAFLQTPAFLTLVQDYPELVPRLMAGMFKDQPKLEDANLLDLLVQREYRGEGSMAALIADVRKIDRSNGLTALQDVPGAGNVNGDADYVAAIAIDAALAGLYHQGKDRRPGQGNSGSFEQVFEQVQGGFRFDISKFSADARELNTRLDHLVTLLLGPEASAAHYTKDARWTLQSGAAALNVTQADDGKNDVMVGFDQGDSMAGGDGDDQLIGLGGNDTLKGGAGIDALVGGDGSDLLEGGAGTDYLYGSAGNDTLDGGANGDWLKGGAGNDTYRLAGAFGSDLIEDSDGQGRIEVDGQAVDGAGAKRASAGVDVWSNDDWVFTLVANGAGGNDLIVQRDSSLNQIRVRNWQPGQLGINLGNEVAQPITSYTLDGDYRKRVVTERELDGRTFEAYRIAGFNYAGDGGQADAQDLLTGTYMADSITGGGGNDGLIGADGDDVIDGGTGADLLFGGNGADTLRGGDGDDFIFGSAAGQFSLPTRTDYTPLSAQGDEVARGFNWVVYDPAGVDGNGNDVYIIAGVGSLSPSAETSGNFIEAGAGNDRVSAGNAGDIVYGGAGADGISGMGGGDVLRGEDGNDVIYGDGKAQQPDGTRYGNYTPAEQHGSDVIDGGGGNDTLVGQGGDDEIYGGADDDLLVGDAAADDAIDTPLIVHGNDWLDGGAGNDTLVGEGREDVLWGGSGNDELYGDGGGNRPGTTQYLAPEYHGADWLDGEEGDDTLLGEGGDDTLFGGADNDLLLGDSNADQLAGSAHGGDYLDGEAGNDTLKGGGGDDELLGGIGNDALFGDGGAGQPGTPAYLAPEFHGGDYLDGEEGDDSLVGEGGDDALFGGEGNDSLIGDGLTSQLEGSAHGSDYLDGEAGNDTLYGSGGADVLIGGDDNDELHGDADGDEVDVAAHGDDDLQGGAGLDSLWGDGGNDTLDGGEGDDLLVGDGSTEAVEGSAHGNDALSGGSGADTLEGSGGADRLDGGEGNDWLIGDAAASAVAGEFHRGDVLDGGAGNDTLFGNGGSDQLSGGDGNDALDGDDPGLAELYHGNDTIDGGAGSDTLFGGAGNDVLSGGSDDDALFGEKGNDALFGDAGNDAISGGDGNDHLDGGDGNDTLFGDAGNDTLMAGAGVDYLDGGAGDDTYVITTSGGADSPHVVVATQGRDTLIVNGSVELAQLTADLDAVGNLRLGGGGVTNPQGLVVVAAGVNSSVATLQIGTQTVSLREHVGANLNTVVTGGSAGESGVVMGGSKADTLTATHAGTVLHGGRGNDTLNLATTGGVTVEMSVGDGRDTLGTVMARGASAQNTLSLGAGFSAASMQLYRTAADANGQSWRLDLNATGDSVTFVLPIAAGAPIPLSAWPFDSVVFADATSLAWQNLVSAAILVPTSPVPTEGNDQVVLSDFADIYDALGGDDLVSGLGGNDSLAGSAGNDTLRGGAGSDTLDGGAGVNVLDGGDDNDTYVMSGTGNMGRIVEGNAADVRPDIVLMPTAATPDNVLVSRTYNDAFPNYPDVTLAAADGSWQFVLERQLDSAGGANRVEEFRFGNGAVWTHQDILSRLPRVFYSYGGGSDFLLGTGDRDVLQGLAGNETLSALGGNDELYGADGTDVLYGGDGQDLLFGGNGDDRLSGDAGNDTLDGGAGRNWLQGGAGNDTYRFGRGAGYSRLQDNTGTSRIEVDADVAPGQVSLSRDGGLLRVSITPSRAQLEVVDFFASPALALEMAFADGTVWNAAAISSRVPTTTADTLTGTPANDVFAIDNAGDVIVEADGQGVDTAMSSVSYQLGAGTENLTLLGSLNLSARGNAGNNVLRGNDGDNVFDGDDPTLPWYAGATTSGDWSWGTDTMIGGRGDDVYFAFTGDQVIEAPGEGVDTVITSSYDFVLPDNVENLRSDFSDGGGTYRLVGNASANLIRGTDRLALTGELDGGAGADTLERGNASGNVVFVVDNVGDVIRNGVSSDTVRSTIDWTLAPGLGNLVLLGTSAVNATGNNLANNLDGSQNSASNTLTGLGGDDVYRVDAGDVIVESAGGGTDTVRVNWASTQHSLARYANVENLWLDDAAGVSNVQGSAADNDLRGNGFANVLIGGDGADRILDSGTVSSSYQDGDVLMGGLGDDTLITSNGADTVAGQEGDDVIEVTHRFFTDFTSATILFGRGAGQDLVRSLDSGVGFVIQLDAGIEPQDLLVTRDQANLVLSLQGGNERVVLENHFENGTSATVIGRLGAVNFAGGVQLMGSQLLLRLNAINGNAGSANGELLLGSAGADNLDALAGNDSLLGYAGDDTLRGSAGDDTLVGGDGVDHLYGGAGNDSIEGGTGIDRVYFALGDGRDTLTAIEQEGDTIVFAAGITEAQLSFARTQSEFSDGDLTISIGGTSDQITVPGYYYGQIPIGLVFADGSQVAGAALLDRLTAIVGTDNADVLNATAVFNRLRGLGGNDTLNGLSSNDTLDGGSGADSMSGGLGDDTYVVDNAADLVVEGLNSGYDNVIASLSYTLPSNVEAVQLAGTANIDATGNSLANYLLGNAGNNVLNGGSGADDMFGGAGDDTYVVNSTGDFVSEEAGQGVDSVQSTIGYTLGENLENLALTGTSSINGTGNALNNVLTGNSGANVLTGAAGDDIYVVGAGDSVVENANEGADSVQSSVSFALGANVENLTLTGTSVINATGNDGNNTLAGNSAANILSGGLGDDVYVFASGSGADTLVEAGGAADRVELGSVFTPAGTTLARTGNDILLSFAGRTETLRISNWFVAAANQIESIAFTDGTVWAAAYVSANARSVINGTAAAEALTGTAADDQINGLAGNDTLDGAAGNDILDGGTGNDSMRGGLGNDSYFVDSATDAVVENLNEGTDTVSSSVSWILGANVENLMLTTSANINGTGNTAANVITGNAGNNALDGGAGADTLIGGAGNDTYTVDDAADVLTELVGEGTDTVSSNVSFTLAANVENLTLTGTAAINGTGNALNNVLTGNAGTNVLTGGAGDDTYVVGSGDTVVEGAGGGIDTVQSSVTTTLGVELENLTLTGTGIANGTGNAANNVLTGNSAANALDGAAGADTLIGGAGDDTYTVDNAGDIVTELAAEGTDLVNSGVTFTLSANIENLTLTGALAVDGTGNTLNNTLRGNAVANTLDGAAGNDSLIGGAGNDTYIVESTTDVVTELAAEGTDTVKSSAATFTLGVNVENLTLTGTAAISGTGNTLANLITGNSAANLLDGGTGADTLVGGAGNDSYAVDNTADVVTELLNEGTDLVTSSATYTLGANVENLTLGGTGVINATGNLLDNVLTGNSAANVLTGGAGNDTYVVGTGDSVVEATSGGTDTVQSSVTWTLSSTAEIENLTLTGSSVINGTGNALNNWLIGNVANNTLTGAAGNDTLDGGLGNDTMVGGLGNDVYVVNATTDVITENANEGTDTVQSSVTLTLTNANLENLELLASGGAINGTGNAGANVLTGNAANNTLSGLAGNDTYIGGGGNDTLTDNSTTSNDTYRWGGGQGNDTITDAGGADRIEIAAGVTASQVSLVRSGNNLQVKISGATDVLTVVNWYTATANRVETIALADGTVINAGATAPLSVTGLSSRELIQMERTSGAPKATFMPSPSTLKLPHAMPTASAVHAVRGTQLLVQAMAQFDGSNGAADITAPVRWRDDRLHVELAMPW